MMKNRKGTYRRGSSQGWRIPPSAGPPAHAAGRSPPPSPSPGPEARALHGPPPIGPFTLTPGPFALTLGHFALTPRHSAPTQGSLGIFGAPPQCLLGISITLPQSLPDGPSPPQAPLDDGHPLCCTLLLHPHRGHLGRPVLGLTAGEL